MYVILNNLLICELHSSFIVIVNSIFAIKLEIFVSACRLLHIIFKLFSY